MCLFQNERQDGRSWKRGRNRPRKQSIEWATAKEEPDTVFQPSCSHWRKSFLHRKLGLWVRRHYHTKLSCGVVNQKRIVVCRINENDLFKDDWRSRSRVQVLQYIFLKWLLAFLVGLLTGIIATLINLAIENIAGYKLLAVLKYIHKERWTISSFFNVELFFVCDWEWICMETGTWQVSYISRPLISFWHLLLLFSACVLHPQQQDLEFLKSKLILMVLILPTCLVLQHWLSR